jgi:hypothetical protein
MGDVSLTERVGDAERKRRKNREADIKTKIYGGGGAPDAGKPRPTLRHSPLTTDRITGVPYSIPL